MEVNEDLDRLKDRMERLSIKLRDARDMIGEGQRIELQGLDSEMNELCVELVRHKPASRQYLPRLERLIDGLNELEAALGLQFRPY